jgi:serine/threonine protein kinase
MNALRVSFTPSQSLHVEQALHNADITELCSNACIGVEAYQAALSQGSSNAGDAGSIQTNFKLALLIPYTLERPAAGEFPDDEEFDDEDVVQMSVIGQAVRITVVLMFKDQTLQNWCRQELVKETRLSIVVSVITVKSAAELEDKLNNKHEPVQAVFIEEEGRSGDEVNSLCNIAFSSQSWGESVVVCVFKTDTRLQRELLIHDESVSAATGGLGGWDRAVLGQPFEISSGEGDDVETSTVERNYRFLLPIARQPLAELLTRVRRIEAHRLELERREIQRNMVLTKQHERGFERIRCLGNGARATVYLMVRDDVQYAMKAISWTDSEGKDRCLCEHSALEQLQETKDKFIVRRPYHYFAEEENTFRLYLEYCEQSLRDVLEPRIPTKGPDAVVQIKKIAVILFQLTTALNEVHKAGWVHHDIKPDNVLIKNVPTERADRFPWEVRLADFSEAADVRMQLSKPRAGTVAYNSIEKLKRHNVTEIDIFALGVLAMKLCGWAPPQWEHIASTNDDNVAIVAMVDFAPKLRQCFRDHVQALPMPKANTLAILTDHLVQFISACLHPDWDQRPSAEALLQYGLLKWIVNENHTNALLDRRLLPDRARSHPNMEEDPDDSERERRDIIRAQSPLLPQEQTPAKPEAVPGTVTKEEEAEEEKHVGEDVPDEGADGWSSASSSG